MEPSRERRLHVALPDASPCTDDRDQVVSCLRKVGREGSEGAVATSNSLSFETIDELKSAGDKVFDAWTEDEVFSSAHPVR